jgi:hypothetical protein
LVWPKSKLSTGNKLLIYKTIVKPIWTCKIQLWGKASTSIIIILEHLQLKALRMIVDAPWYVPNTVIQRDLQTPIAKEEICCYSCQYSAHFSVHPNDPVVSLMEQPDNSSVWEDTYQIICLCSSGFLKVLFVSLIPKSHKRPWTY